MLSLGTVPANTTLYIPFATYDGATGASESCSGLAVTDIKIYKNGSTTQRASDAGYALLDTDGMDFDEITGINGFSIDLSNNTDAGFYAVGSWYWVVVSSITADAQTVNFIAAVFRIGPAEGTAGYQPVDVARISNDSDAADNAELMFDGTGYAGGATKLVVAPVTLADDAITSAKFDESTAFPLTSADAGATAVARTGADADTLETLSDQIDGIEAGSGLTAQEVRDALKLAPTAGDPAAGSVDAQLTAIVADTNELQAEFADGGRLDLLIDGIKTKTDGLNFTGTDVKATLDGETVSLSDDQAVNVTKWGGAAVGGMPNSGKVAVSLAAVDVSGNLPADVKAYTVQPTVTGATLSSEYDAAKTAAPTAEAVADQVWNEATGDHATAGSTGKVLADAKAVTDKLDSMIEVVP